MPRKRKLYAFVSVLSLTALAIAGTFAWTNFDSSIINNFFGTGAGSSPTEGPGGTLHNDMAADEPFRDVYVENWGTEPLIVRIHLSEFMEMGEGAGNPENNQAVSLIDGATFDDVTSWEPFNGNLDSVLRRDGNTSNETFSDFWQWTMGGQKYFIPAPEDLRGTVDANGTEFVSTNSPFFVDENDDLDNMRQTLNAEVITMSEWLESRQLGHFWVVDSDGYSYWASPLLPDEATGLLLHKVELIEQPVYDFFYAINVAAHMATIDDAPDNYERMILDASTDAEELIRMLADAIRSDDPLEPEPTPPLAQSVRLTNHGSFSVENSRAFWSQSSLPVTMIGGYRSRDTIRLSGANWYEGFARRSFSVNGQFSHIEGTIFVQYPQRDTAAIGNLILWGDGVQLYRSPDITAGSLPVGFDVDISDVRVLRVEFEYRNHVPNEVMFNFGISDTLLVR